MSFDPPPTDNHAANKPRPSIHLSRSFSSTRSTPILEPPAYSAEDVLANKYRKVSKLVSSLRTAVTAITLAVSITVIACAASSLRSYGGTKSTGDWWLPLWPSSVDLRPTHVVLSCGVIITIFSLAYLALALFPSVSGYYGAQPLLPTNSFFFSLVLSSTYSTLPPQSCPASASLLPSSPAYLPLRSIPVSPTTPPPGPCNHGRASGQASKVWLRASLLRSAWRAWCR